NVVGANLPEGKRGLSRTLRLFATARSGLLLVLFLLVFGYFSASIPHFFEGYNVYQVVQNGVIIGLLAIGESIVILSGGGGIDLSVGSMLSLSGMVLGILNIVHGVNIWVAVIAAIITGTLLGAINGFLVSKIRIPPLIVTLATYYGYAAIALQVTNTKPLPDATQTNLPQAFPQEFIALGNGNVQNIDWLSWIPKIAGQGIPFQFLIIFVPVLLIVIFVLHKTLGGRYLYGVGTNALAARFTAIDVWTVRFWAYVAAGFLAGVGAVIQTALNASATPDVGAPMNLQAITIAVLGGVSIMGGEGAIGGVALATLIVVFLYNGLGLLLGDAAGVWQPVALGALLICSVVFNEFIRRRVSVE
ncbi:MAG: ABC transporter permease, partial [Ktedonobacteraceae bacterium]|nr:ABC transporter permease [Ktedonobacteraceae bacterium]